MRVIVCGARDFRFPAVLKKALNGQHATSPITVVIHGGAQGADAMADAWAKNNGVPVIRMEAHWHRLGKRAGPVRNQWMIDHCAPDLVIAFPGGRGTQDMVSRALAANVPVLEPVPSPAPDMARAS